MPASSTTNARKQSQAEAHGQAPCLEGGMPPQAMPHSRRSARPPWMQLLALSAGPWTLDPTPPTLAKPHYACASSPTAAPLTHDHIQPSPVTHDHSMTYIQQHSAFSSTKENPEASCTFESVWFGEHERQPAAASGSDVAATMNPSDPATIRQPMQGGAWLQRGYLAARRASDCAPR